MARTWRHVTLMLVRAACTSLRGAGTADAGTSGEGWARRKLHGGMLSQLRRNADECWTQAPRGDAGAAAGAFLLWPLLAGACLASRA